MSRRLIGIVAVLAVLIVACGDDAAPTTTAPPEGSAPITIVSVQLRQIGSDPTTVKVDVFGTKPSPCHTLDAVITTGGKDVIVQIWAVPPIDQVCAQVITDFDVTLDLGSFPAGSYHVAVNDRAYEMTT